MCVHIYIYTHTYIYIYTEREMDRERERCIHIYISIYIYICIHICTCACMYTYLAASRVLCVPKGEVTTLIVNTVFLVTTIKLWPPRHYEKHVTKQTRNYHMYIYTYVYIHTQILNVMIPLIAHCPYSNRVSKDGHVTGVCEKTTIAIYSYK